MFEHKFIGKPVNNCGLKEADWNRTMYTDSTSKDCIIYALLSVEYGKLIWVETYEVFLNFYTLTGKIQSFSYRLAFKTEKEALDYLNKF